MENRKQEEVFFHDRLRDPELRNDPEKYAYYTANRKYYAVARKSQAYYADWLLEHSPGRRVLEYGCGNGQYSIAAARAGATAVGIDISPVSVENGRRAAEREGVADRATYRVMDCEALDFPDGSFDVVCESGVLHHLDLDKALPEIARVLTPGGQVICAEALGHNAAIQLYRRLTPHLRTEWETDHIIRRRDIERMRKWFGRVEMRFFHMASLAAVPFRDTALFAPLLRVLEMIDDALLKLPVIRWQAWQVVYVASDPLKKR